MHFNLLMLNLFIGMCKGTYGLPKNLKKLGYSEKWIEHKFANQDLREVHPELIISSDITNHTILLESKSGKNTSDEQLLKYSRITKTNLISGAFISRKAANLHDIAIVGKIENGNRLKIGIEQGGYPFPLILKSAKGLSLSYNQFKVNELNNFFTPFLKINWKYVPYSFVPLNNESKPWEIADILFPILLKYMNDAKTDIPVEEICHDICNIWGNMGEPGKNDFRSKIKDVVKQASRFEYKGIIRFSGKRGGKLEIINNPLGTDVDRRPGIYRKLREKQKNFIERLKTGKPFKGQMELELEY